MWTKGVIILASKKHGVGYRVKNKQGDWMEVVEYISSQNITIKFDNGEMLKVNSSSLGEKYCDVLPPSKKNNYTRCEKHGERYTKLWKEWNTMRWRCNPKNKRHSVWYSDKGIKVCEEWNLYTNFRNWALSNGFNENLTIDRIDEKVDYCPSNCRWLTLAENVSRISECKRWISVIKCDVDGNKIKEYSNITNASKDLGLSCYASGIKECCDHKRDVFHGFKWMYSNEN